MANRLSVLLKRRYLGYLTKIGSDLNRPKFDKLGKFVASEQSVSTSNYAQTFLSRRKKKGGERGCPQHVRVWKVAVNSNNGLPPSGHRQQGSNLP